jgi:hypothetical protein
MQSTLEIRLVDWMRTESAAHAATTYDLTGLASHSGAMRRRVAGQCFFFSLSLREAL